MVCAPNIADTERVYLTADSCAGRGSWVVGRRSWVVGRFKQPARRTVRAGDGGACHAWRCIPMLGHDVSSAHAVTTCHNVTGPRRLLRSCCHDVSRRDWTTTSPLLMLSRPITTCETGLVAATSVVTASPQLVHLT